MPTALVLSPHLDDAAFSCGGTVVKLARAGWHVCLATAFTRTVLPATGFALACQLDKGLGPDVDYMALRRAEDRAAATIMGVADLRWLDLPEAPHRGYHTAPALFADVRDGDDVWQELAACIARLVAELEPALILAPQGLGNHVDHQQMIRALAGASRPLAFYRDTPYAIRNPGALPNVAIGRLEQSRVDIPGEVGTKIAAACAYGSQIGFQFGGAAGVDSALHTFAIAEGDGVPAERFIGAMPPL